MVISKPLSIEDREALEEFYIKAYPYRKDITGYLSRTIFSLPQDSLKESIVIYDNNKIVGVNLGIPTYVRIGLDENKIAWSYDTLVLPEYRNSEAGTIIAEFWYKRKFLFGAGLSEISEKMGKVMKSKHIAYATAYIKPNLKS